MLRDYMHCVQASSGFSAEVDDHLSAAMKLVSCENHEKLVMLLLDEIHVREKLVFEKHEGSLIGFANVGDINTHHTYLHSKTNFLRRSIQMRSLPRP